MPRFTLDSITSNSRTYFAEFQLLPHIRLVRTIRARYVVIWYRIRLRKMKFTGNNRKYNSNIVWTFHGNDVPYVTKICTKTKITGQRTKYDCSMFKRQGGMPRLHIISDFALFVPSWHATVLRNIREQWCWQYQNDCGIRVASMRQRTTGILRLAAGESRELGDGGESAADPKSNFAELQRGRYGWGMMWEWLIRLMNGFKILPT